MELYPFQQTAVEFHLEHRYVLNCSEMGTGKTIMALATAKEVGITPDVFGPAFLQSTWRTDAAKLDMDIRYHPYSRLKAVNVSALGNFFIGDEIHFCKNPQAIRTADFYGMLKQRQPAYFLGLTGTPIKNRVPDFWTLLGMCSANPVDSNGIKLTGDLAKYYKFCRYFCETQQLQFGKRKIEKFLHLKEKLIPEFKQLLKGKYIRFKVADVLQDLPSLTRKYIQVNVAPVSGLEQTFEDYMSGRKRDIAAKVQSAVLKVPYTVEYVKGMLDEGASPIIVFTDHIDSGAAIHAHIAGSAVISGKTPMDLRQRAVESFQAGHIPALVATIGSLSVGVTLHAARHVVFNDLSWTPADNLQAEKRIHRIGQGAACFAHYIDGTDTDAHIRKTLFEKMTAIDQIVT